VILRNFNYNLISYFRVTVTLGGHLILGWATHMLILKILAKGWKGKGDEIHFYSHTFYKCISVWQKLYIV
jgi:hypothetical protein